VAQGSKLIANPQSTFDLQQVAEINGISNRMLFKDKGQKRQCSTTVLNTK